MEKVAFFAMVGDDGPPKRRKSNQRGSESKERIVSGVAVHDKSV